MSSLQIGDYVKVRGGSYSLVYTFGHYNTATKAMFLQIHTGEDHPPLEISAQHLLYVKKATTKAPKLLPAKKVEVGDYLVTEHDNPQKVTSIYKVQLHGFYAPHTATGEIVVSGVLASSYATRTHWIDKVPVQMLHWLQRGADVPYRLFCGATGCKEEVYDRSTGFSLYNMIWFRLEQWQLDLPFALQVAFLVFLAAPVLFCSIILGLLISSGTAIVVAIHLTIAALGYLLVRRRHMTLKKLCSCSPMANGINKSITN